MAEGLEVYKKTTILFPVRGNDVLLAMKKQGFGVGWWNGYGGKLEDGESYEDAAIRETHEEGGLIIRSLHHVASLHFYFGDQLGVDRKSVV